MVAKRAKRIAAKIRKSGTAEEVAKHHDKADAKAKTGGELTTAKDGDLFVVDTAATPAALINARPSRAARREAAKSHTLAVDQVVSAGKSPYTYPLPGVHKKVPGPTTLKKLLDIRPHAAAAKEAVRELATGRVSKRKPKKEMPKYDLWNTEDYDVNNVDLAKMGQYTCKATKRMVGIKPLNDIAAVEVDDLGCSYNPPVDAHQEMLAKAVGEEMAKDLKRELQPTIKPLTATQVNNLVEEEIFRTHVESDESEDEEEGAAGPSGTDAEALKRSKVVVNKKMTKAERNKQALRKLREREHAANVAEKRLKKQVNNISEIQRDLDEEDRARAHERDRLKNVKAEKRQVEPRRLGKRRFHPEPVQVQLTEEVTGSMRQLKGCHTLIRDRYKSFQKREIIEPRVQQIAKKSKHYTEVDNGTKGDRERESFKVLMAEKAMGKSML